MTTKLCAALVGLMLMPMSAAVAQPACTGPKVFDGTPAISLLGSAGACTGSNWSITVTVHPYFMCGTFFGHPWIRAKSTQTGAAIQVWAGPACQPFGGLVYHNTFVLPLGSFPEGDTVVFDLVVDTGGGDCMEAAAATSVVVPQGLCSPSCSGGAPTAPTLAATQPFIGQSMTLMLASAAANAPVLYFHSADVISSGPIPSVPSCTTTMNPATLGLLVQSMTTPAGMEALSFGIPPNPALIGKAFSFTAAIITPTSPFGFNHTNSVLVIIG